MQKCKWMLERVDDWILLLNSRMNLLLSKSESAAYLKAITLMGWFVLSSISVITWMRLNNFSKQFPTSSCMS